ncbi:MAG: MaoC/PaaZ C-terminal domain-containing protein [Nitrospinota bacterium]
MAERAGKYFEDFAVGDRLETNARTMTEFDVMTFVTLVGYLEPLFIDEGYIREKSGFGDRIAPGLLTTAMADALIAQTGVLHGTGMALLGIRDLQIRAPAKVGDTIRVEVEVTEKRETSRPDRGVVTSRQVVRNQRGEPIVEYVVSRLIRRRSTGDAGAGSG